MTKKRRRRHKPEEIVRKLRDADAWVAQIARNLGAECMGGSQVGPALPDAESRGPPTGRDISRCERRHTPKRSRTSTTCSTAAASPNDNGTIDWRERYVYDDSSAGCVVSAARPKSRSLRPQSATR